MYREKTIAEIDEDARHFNECRNAVIDAAKEFIEYRDDAQVSFGDLPMRLYEALEGSVIHLSQATKRVKDTHVGIGEDVSGKWDHTSFEEWYSC